VRDLDTLVVGESFAGRSDLWRALVDRGFAVDIRSSLLDGLRSLANRQPDAVILDIGSMNSEKMMAVSMFVAVSVVPIVAIVESDHDAAVLNSLDVHIWLRHPVGPTALADRVEDAIRRSLEREAGDGTVLSVGGISIFLGERVVRLNGRALSLNRTEFDLLAYLSARQGHIVARRDLIRAISKRGSVSRAAIDVYVSGLRRKLGETAANPKYLHTVHGKGVVLMAPSQQDVAG
jgi:DNA-binding response OmpR family regulator